MLDPLIIVRAESPFQGGVRATFARYRHYTLDACLHYFRGPRIRYDANISLIMSRYTTDNLVETQSVEAPHLDSGCSMLLLLHIRTAGWYVGGGFNPLGGLKDLIHSQLTQVAQRTARLPYAQGKCSALQMYSLMCVEKEFPVEVHSSSIVSGWARHVNLIRRSNWDTLTIKHLRT